MLRLELKKIRNVREILGPPIGEPDVFAVRLVGGKKGPYRGHRLSNPACPCSRGNIGQSSMLVSEGSCATEHWRECSAMSMPRKAMQELGLQACCLRCDAPDDGGMARCGGCIQHHRNVRETIAAAPPDDPLFQFARELMAMAAAPHRYSHDEVHGTSLIEQQRLAAALTDAPPPRTEEDVVTLFEEQRKVVKTNVLREIGNQNPWKDKAPEAKKAQEMGQEVWDIGPGEIDQHYGARTVPSKPIATVDRSERSGEDTALTDRVHAAAKTTELDEDAAKIFEELDFKQRQSKRASLKSAMREVKELIDDDLEF